MGAWLDLGGALFTVCGALFVVWVIIRAWTRPRPDETPAASASAAAPPLDLPPAGRWALDLIKRPFMVYDDMSSDRGQAAAVSPVADRLPATSTAAGQGVAMPGNAGNAELPGNALPEAARDIVRFQARVEAVIAIVDSGKVGQVEAIERIFKCKRSGRPESPYAKARAAVEAQMPPARPELIGEMIARVEREVAAEH